MAYYCIDICFCNPNTGHHSITTVIAALFHYDVTAWLTVDRAWSLHQLLSVPVVIHLPSVSLFDSNKGSWLISALTAWDFKTHPQPIWPAAKVTTLNFCGDLWPSDAVIGDNVRCSLLSVNQWSQRVSKRKIIAKLPCLPTYLLSFSFTNLLSFINYLTNNALVLSLDWQWQQRLPSATGHSEGSDVWSLAQHHWT